jgi:hypothetical protein
VNKVQKVMRWLIFTREERLAIKKAMYEYRNLDELTTELYEQIWATLELDHKE